jgi:hypothetical protein
MDATRSKGLEALLLLAGLLILEAEGHIPDLVQELRHAMGLPPMHKYAVILSELRKGSLSGLTQVPDASLHSYAIAGLAVIASVLSLQ